MDIPVLVIAVALQVLAVVRCVFFISGWCMLHECFVRSSAASVCELDEGAGAKLTPTHDNRGQTR